MAKPRVDGGVLASCKTPLPPSTFAALRPLRPLPPVKLGEGLSPHPLHTRLSAARCARPASSIASGSVPTVLLNDHTRGTIGSIAVDDYSAARLATGHLVELGHRRIAFLQVDGPKSRTDRRRRGWEDALRTAGIEPDPRLVAIGGHTPEDGEEGMRYLLEDGGFTAVFVQRNDVLGNLSLGYGALFLVLCLAAHAILRLTLPDADPYLFPLVALLACFGLVMIYRLDEDLAREQAQWFVIGLVAFAGTIVLLRDYMVLERYRYTIALISLGLLMAPRLPLIGSQVNGAYLGISFGPISAIPARTPLA